MITASSKSCLRMDPRAKLILLLLGNITLFFHISTTAEVMLMAFIFTLFFLSKKYKSGIRLLLLYAILLSAEIWLLPIAEGLLQNVCSMFTVGIRMIAPCIVTGSYLFTTTTVGEMVCAMRKMRISESIVIPCVVVVRFFPTIIEDYKQIRNAMTLRGIISGKGSLIKHPFQSLEYILIPLLMNSSSVAEDLTAAALTRGISLEGKHTSMVEISMKAFDWFYIVLCSMPFILFWAGVL